MSLPYSPVILADSPALYWRLGESGATAADTSGNGRTGTYNGSPLQQQASLINDDPSFNPDATATEYVQSTVLLNTSLATVEVWFDYDGSVPAATHSFFIAGFGASPASGVFDKDIYIDDQGRVVFYVYDGAEKAAIGPVLQAGVYHLVGVIDGTNAFIYVDGNQVGSVAATGSYAGYVSNNVFVGGFVNGTGGASLFGGDTAFSGRRDEFAVYTSALSPARISVHFAAGVSGPSGIPDFQRKMFPFIIGDNRMQGVSRSGARWRTGGRPGPAPIGGFERFIFPRLHPVYGGTTFNQALDAAVTVSALFINVVGKVLSATTTSSATAVRQVGKVVSAASTSTASIVKRVGKSVLATVTSTASILAQKVKMQALTATVTVTASIVRQVGKLVSATATSTASLAKNVNKTLTATVTSTAVLAAIRVFIRVLTATVTTTASMVRQVGFHINASVSSTASIVKQVGKRLTASTVTSTASLTAIRVFLRILSATVTSTASMTRQTGKVLTGAVSASASASKRVGKTLVATVTSLASLLAEAVIAGAIQVVGAFGIRPRGRTTVSPLEADFDSRVKGETAISPEEADFAISPKGRT